MTEVRRGEDDGSFILSYKPPAGSGIEGLIEITGLIPGRFRGPRYRVSSNEAVDLGDYPTQHQTYLYTSSADVPTYITDTLNSIEVHSLPLSRLLESIAVSLNRAVTQKSQKSGKIIFIDVDESMEEEEEEEEDEADDDSIGGWSDDGAARLNTDHEDSQINDELNDYDRPEILPNLRHDLREAKAAGFRVGVLGDIKGGIDCYISLSIRISKLGLSDEATSAWKLTKNRYFILLIHYNHYYKSLAELLRHSYHAKQSIQFRVGTSKHYKPTLVEAIGAFSKIQPTQGEGAVDESVKVTDEGFKTIFIARPLNELLNSRLVDLVTQRVKHKLSWDGSERFLAGTSSVFFA